MFTHSSLISFSYLGLCIFHENNQHFQLLTSTKLPWNTHIYVCFLNRQQQTWVIKWSGWPTDLHIWAYSITRDKQLFLQKDGNEPSFTFPDWYHHFFQRSVNGQHAKDASEPEKNLSVGWVSREAHKDYPLYQCDRAHIPMDRSWGEQHESELRKCSVNIWQITAAASCL